MGSLLSATMAISGTPSLSKSAIIIGVGNFAGMANVSPNHAASPGLPVGLSQMVVWQRVWMLRPAWLPQRAADLLAATAPPIYTQPEIRWCPCTS